MKPAYVIGQISVRDAAKWAEYRSRVPATLAPWGAELLFRGAKVAQLEGALAHEDIVAIRFPSVAAANGWHESPAYQALVPLRREAAEVLLFLYEE